MRGNSFFCLLISILFITLTFSVFSQPQETITITTYYPAPYGVYKELHVLGGDLFVEREGDRRIHIISENGEAGIEIRAEGSQNPYIDFSNSPDINYGVRVWAPDNDTLRVTSGYLRAKMAPTGVYFRIYKVQQ